MLLTYIIEIAWLWHFSLCVQIKNTVLVLAQIIVNGLPSQSQMGHSRPTLGPLFVWKPLKALSSSPPYKNGGNKHPHLLPAYNPTPKKVNFSAMAALLLSSSTFFSNPRPFSSSRPGSTSPLRFRQGVRPIKCKAVEQGSSDGVDAAVYRGVYGPWTVDASDVREVRLLCCESFSESFISQLIFQLYCNSNCTVILIKFYYYCVKSLN